MSEWEFTDFMERFDTDGSGLVDVHEFETFMQYQLEQEELKKAAQATQRPPWSRNFRQPENKTGHAQPRAFFPTASGGRNNRNLLDLNNGKREKVQSIDEAAVIKLEREKAKLDTQIDSLLREQLRIQETLGVAAFNE
jgi:hypothetical protein